MKHKPAEKGILFRGRVPGPTSDPTENARAGAALDASISTAAVEGAWDTIRKWDQNEDLDIRRYVRPKTAKKRQERNLDDLRQRAAERACIATQRYEEFLQLTELIPEAQALRDKANTYLDKVMAKDEWKKRREAERQKDRETMKAFLTITAIEMGIDLDFELLCGCTVGHLATSMIGAAILKGTGPRTLMGILIILYKETKAQQEQATKGHLDNNPRWPSKPGPWEDSLKTYHEGQANLRKAKTQKQQRETKRQIRDSLKQIREITRSQGLDLSLRDIEIQIQQAQEKHLKEEHPAARQQKFLN